MSDEPSPFSMETITFENGQSAEELQLKQPLEASVILSNFRIQKKAKSAFLVCGTKTSFESRLKNRLLDLLSRGLAQAALDNDALIINGGTREGVGELVGQSVADRGRNSTLIGVMKKTKSDQGEKHSVESTQGKDQNHTHFVLTEEEWPNWQAETMCQLAEAGTSESEGQKKHILTLLVGGELQGSALETSLETVRREWPLLVIEGSGPLADEIINFKKYQQTVAKRTGWLWKLIYRLSGGNKISRLRSENPRLFEIISDGNISVVSKENDADQLRGLIKGLFKDPRQEDVLWTAWQRFAEYDLNSIRHRNQWRRLKNYPLILGVMSTLIVLIYSATNTNLVIEGSQSSLWVNAYSSFMGSLAGLKANPVLDLIFRFVIILLPLSTSLILAVETRLKLGSKYILLRGAAEAVKRGIYSLRTLGKIDENKITDKRLPHNEKSLAEHLTRISKLLLESDVNEAAFNPYKGGIPPNMYGAEAYDDGFSPLDPDTYVRIRIGDQLQFYTQRTNQFEKRIRRLQIWMLIWGGIGTFLAAIGAQYWLPFTAAIVSAMTAFLEYRQLEQTLTKYNLTKSSLENVRSNWLAQQSSEMSEEQRLTAVQNLVREVEATLESENQGWVQYVSQAQDQDNNGNQTDDTTPFPDEADFG